jgi:transposase
MTDYQLISSNTVLVAIDIAKVRNEVLIERPGRKRRKRLSVLNIHVEHDRFIENLAAFDCPVVVGFGATGNYHRAIASRLLDAGFDVRLSPSVGLARTRESPSQRMGQE